MPARNNRPISRRPYHWLNDFGEATCKSPEKSGCGEALTVLDHDEACLNCVRIVLRTHSSVLRSRWTVNYCPRALDSLPERPSREY